MGKFRKQLVAEIEKEKEQEIRQKKLHEKYHVPEDIMIVEKDNTVKFFVRTTGSVIKVITGIVIFILAVIGIAALIFPGSRAELLHEALTTWKELKNILPGM